MYVTWFDTVMLYYVILVNLVNVTFTIFKFPAVPSPYVPMLAGDGTQMTDAGIRWITLPGTPKGGHRGSAGQGK
ncbi:unnamed protein product [Staurois parvus]|uniref:ATP synthase F0 subunit 8 n=1 Tax=Staurois parvus TaxID=386267 RepID=A0ABN9CBL1_9NEOB|nr:unnamed protein product [Staurois parvus]